MCARTSFLHCLDLKLFLLWFVWIPCLFTCVERAAAGQMERRRGVYPALPTGKPYKLNAESLSSSSGLEDIAAGVATIIISHPPYDIINHILQFQDLPEDFLKKVLGYEAPLIGLAAASFVFAIVIPITGLIVFCCRLAGKCGGRMDDSQLDIRPTKKRKRFSLALVVCTIFLMYVLLIM